MKKIIITTLILITSINISQTFAYNVYDDGAGKKNFKDYEISSYKGDFVKNKDNVSVNISGYMDQPFKIDMNEIAYLPNNFIIKDYTLFTSLFEQNGVYSVNNLITDLSDINKTTLDDGYTSPKPIGMFFKDKNLAKKVGISPEKYKNDVEKGLPIFLSKSLYDSLKDLGGNALPSLFLNYGAGGINNTLGASLNGKFKTIKGSDTFDLCKAEKSENEYVCTDLLNNLKNEYLKGTISDDDFKNSFTTIYDTKNEQTRSINIKVFVADSIIIKNPISKGESIEVKTIIDTKTASKYNPAIPQSTKENIQALKRKIADYKSKLDSNGLTELNGMLLKINNYIKLGDLTSIENLLQDYNTKVGTLEGKLKEITKGKSSSDVDYLAQTDKTFASSRQEYKNKLYINMIISSYYQNAGQDLINKARFEKLKSLLEELRSDYENEADIKNFLFDLLNPNN